MFPELTDDQALKIKDLAQERNKSTQSLCKTGNNRQIIEKYLNSLLIFI
jgi:hypothetical protein